MTEEKKKKEEVVEIKEDKKKKEANKKKVVEEKTEQDDVQSAKYLLIGVVGLVILFFIFFFLGKALAPKAQLSDYMYNGFTFVEQEPFWMTQVQLNDKRTTIPFYFHPESLEDVNYELGVAQKILELPPEGRVFITLDPDNATPKLAIAGVEISKIIGTKNNLLNIETHSATTKQEEGLEEYPVKTCADANDFTAVIYLSFGPNNLIYSEGNCVILEAINDEQLIRLADRLSYGLLGIMPQ